MTDNKDNHTELVLPELDETTPLPVITEGGLSGCFLAHCLFVDLPNRKLPKLVSDNWQFDEVDGQLKTNNIFVAVEASLAHRRAATVVGGKQLTLFDALFDVINFCAFSNRGSKVGVKAALLKHSKTKTAFARFQMLNHDGTGFETAEHPLVLRIDAKNKISDVSVLSVLGNPEIQGEMRTSLDEVSVLPFPSPK